uniref:Uncharacterized protein n=1 Tax=Romanomermis culicivorax TaxID=13658 RepID=A0A915JZP8_ROMCU
MLLLRLSDYLDHAVTSQKIAKIDVSANHGFRNRKFLLSPGRNNHTYPNNVQWWDSSSAILEGLQQ